MNGKQKQLQEQTYDVEYALNYLQEVNKSLPFFQSIKDSLQNSIVNIANFHKQQQALFLKQQEEQKLAEQQQQQQQQQLVNNESIIPSSDQEIESNPLSLDQNVPSSDPSTTTQQEIPIVPSNDFQEVEPTIVKATSSKKNKKKKNQMATLEESTPAQADDDSMKPKEF